MSLLREEAIRMATLETLEILIERILRPLYLFVLTLAPILVKVVELIQVACKVRQIS